MVVDYTKFDQMKDSDEEEEKERKPRFVPSKDAGTTAQNLVEVFYEKIPADHLLASRREWVTKVVTNFLKQTHEYNKKQLAPNFHKRAQMFEMHKRVQVLLNRLAAGGYLQTKEEALRMQTTARRAMASILAHEEESGLTQSFKSFPDTISSEHKCSDPVESLKPILVSEMTPFTVHKGRCLTLKTICLPSKIVSIHLFGEDEKGTVAKLTIYNLDSSSSGKTLEEMFPIGATMVVKEPYWKIGNDGVLFMRMDNPNENLVVDLSDVPVQQSSASETPTITEDEHKLAAQKKEKEFKRKAKQNTLPEHYRQKGNALFRNGNYEEAAKLYTQALKCKPVMPTLRTSLHNNRSMAYIKCGKFLEARGDCLKVLYRSKDNIKALHRLTSALSSLGRHQNAAATLKKLTSLRLFCNEKPSNEAKALSKRVHRRRAESEGDFKSFCTLKLLADGKLDFEDISEFYGPVVVKESTNNRRGVFLTKDVKKQELLFVTRTDLVALKPQSSNISLTDALTMVIERAAEKDLLKIRLGFLYDGDGKNIPPCPIMDLYRHNDHNPLKFQMPELTKERLGGIIKHCSRMMGKNDLPKNSANTSPEGGVFDHRAHFNGSEVLQLHPFFSFLKTSSAESKGNLVWEEELFAFGKGRLAFWRAKHDLSKGTELVLELDN